MVVTAAAKVTTGATEPAAATGVDLVLAAARFRATVPAGATDADMVPATDQASDPVKSSVADTAPAAAPDVVTEQAEVNAPVTDAATVVDTVPVATTVAETVHALATVADSVPALEQVWSWLEAVPDPEIPVISLVDLGIIRDVAWQGDTLVVTVTPTYSGCPATSIINLDIETALRGHGIETLEIKRLLSPAWTTEWLSDAGRAKLEDYGIAPPQPAGGPERCPNCQATALSRVSQFGSTPCKALWRCDSCLEPFDYFKCI